MTRATGLSARPGTRRRITASGVAGFVGKIVTAAVVVAAGGAGWFAADTYADGILERPVEDSATVVVATLPELGEGLPESRMNAPAPWPTFTLAYNDEVHRELYWFDLGRQHLRAEIVTGTTSDVIEVADVRGYRRTGDSDTRGEWIEQDAEAVSGVSSYVLGGIGPFVLTDLVPPTALGFTSLELEGTGPGGRVYEVAVDIAGLRERHPLAYEQWAATTRIIGEGSGSYRIRVRDDGYVVRVDGDTSSLEWTDLGSVPFASPLAAVSSDSAPNGSLDPAIGASVPVTALPEL